MAHDCVMLKVHVDPLALYRCDNPDALGFLQRVLTLVDSSRREENARHEAAMRRASRGG